MLRANYAIYRIKDTTYMKKSKRDIYPIYDSSYNEMQFHISYGKKNKRKVLTYYYPNYKLTHKITTHHPYPVLALADLLFMCKCRWFLKYIYIHILSTCI